MRVLVLCLLVGVLQTRAAPLSDTEKAKLSSYHKQCLTESKVDEAIVQENRNGIYSEDLAFQNYIYCFSQKIGFQNQDGEVQKEVFEKKIEHLVEDKEIFNRLVKECTVPKESPQETAFFIAKCMREVSPNIEIFKVSPLSEDQKNKLSTYHQECLQESKVDEAIVQKARKGIYSEEPAFKNYLFCFSQKVGFQNEEGVVQKNIFEKKLLQIIDDKQIFKKLVNECAVEKDTPQETAFFIAKCMREVSPNSEIFKVDSLITQEQKESRTQLLQKCQEETKVPTEVVQSARKGEFQDDPLLKDYLFCVNNKSEVLTESGFYDIDLTKQKMRDVFGDEKGDQISQKCIRNMEDPLITVFEASKCIHFIVPESSLVF